MIRKKCLEGGIWIDGCDYQAKQGKKLLNFAENPRVKNHARVPHSYRAVY